MSKIFTEHEMASFSRADIIEMIDTAFQNAERLFDDDLADDARKAEQAHDELVEELERRDLLEQENRLRRDSVEES